MKNSEIWKPIEEFNGSYHISNHGRIKSFLLNSPGKIMRPKIQKNGYTRYQLSIKGIKCSYYGHRLCAQYFLENPDNLPEIHHKNGKRSDNNVENLSWTSHLNNVRLDQSFVVECKHADGTSHLAYGLRHASSLTGITRRIIMNRLEKGTSHLGWTFKYKNK